MNFSLQHHLQLVRWTFKWLAIISTTCGRRCGKLFNELYGLDLLVSSASWYLMFLTGAIFGKVMEDSGAADSVSKWIVSKIGMKRAALAVVIACAVLTYGGVSLFVVAFSVYPMAIKFI